MAELRHRQSPSVADADDADIDLDTQELVEKVPEEPLGYGYGEWASGPLRTFAGRGPRGYQRTDAQIYEDICERLTMDSRIDASQIEVDVRDGEVALHGHVPTREMRRRAEDLSFDITGVRHGDQ
jgi:hypothetical protein